MRLLSYIKKIEKRMGRTPSFPSAPRIIDIDILFYGNEIVEAEELVIPHPRLSQRAFVLSPLVELEPDFVHPGEGKTITLLLASLKDPGRVIRLQHGLPCTRLG